MLAVNNFNVASGCTLAVSDNGGGFPEGLGERLNAIEDYIASSDEFIVEAARQAAETVVEAYSRNGFAAP